MLCFNVIMLFHGKNSSMVVPYLMLFGVKVCDSLYLPFHFLFDISSIFIFIDFRKNNIYSNYPLT